MWFVIFIALSIVSLIPSVIGPNSLIGIEIFIIIGIFLAIAGIVFGFIGKKGSKGLSIAGIIVGFVAFGILCLSLIGIIGIEKFAKNCVDNGDGFATCEYLDQELEVPVNYLKEEQMKKGE